MIRKGFRVNYIPLKSYASMVPDAACQPVQEYDVTTGEFYPDRGLVPLVLTPMIGYNDPNTGTEVGNAAAELTDGHWYRLDNTTGGKCDSTTEITSGTKYAIDTVAGSETYGRIRIMENVLPGNPVTYVFRATLVAPSGETILKEISWQARTKSTETMPVLKLDNATESMYNPWEDGDAFTLNPVLTPALAGATYAWETQHGGAWGALDSTPLDWAVAKAGDGVRISRSVMQDRVDLRCTVSYTVNGKKHTDSVTASVRRVLPKFDYDITRVSGISATDRSIAPMAVIRAAKGLVTDPGGEVSVSWYNAAGSVVGTGMNPVIALSSLGGELELGLDIRDNGGWCALQDGDGAYLTDGDGALLIVR